MTDKQTEFVRQYLIDLNATQAAIRAGYSVKTARSMGAENLTKPDIAAAIKKALERRAARTEVTQDRVVKEFARIGFSDHRTLFDATGRLKAPADLDDDTAAVVASVEVYEEFERRDGEKSLAGHTKKVKLWDKVAALDKLARHLGMYTDKLEITGPGGGPMVNEVLIEHHAAAKEQLAAGGSDGGPASPSIPSGPDASVA